MDWRRLKNDETMMSMKDPGVKLRQDPRSADGANQWDPANLGKDWLTLWNSPPRLVAAKRDWISSYFYHSCIVLSNKCRGDTFFPSDVFSGASKKDIIGMLLL
jgi:hypothetical protein